jgi:hypothetical protein
MHGVSLIKLLYVQIMMKPLSILGKELKDVQPELGMVVVEGIYSSLEEGEDQEYSVESEDGTWEILLSLKNRIKTIFLHLNRGHVGFAGVTAKMSKEEVLKVLGTPDSEGHPHVDPILGSYAGWEKYLRDDHYLHIEHENQCSGVKMITLMSVNPIE